MSRGIRMNMFVTKAMKDQKLDQAQHHSQRGKKRKQDLIAQYRKGQFTPKKNASKKKQPKEVNADVKRLKQRIQRLEQAQQSALAKQQRKERQYRERILKLKADNRTLRQQISTREKQMVRRQQANDQAATKLMGEYIELSSWLKTFTNLDININDGRTARQQLMDEQEETAMAQLVMLRILTLAWDYGDSNKARARRYDVAKRQCDRLANQLKLLQKGYQQQVDEKRHLKKKLKQTRDDAEAVKERLLSRYLNGEQLGNAFHILFDNLKENTVQQYGALAPLLDKFVTTFTAATQRNDRHDFIYGYFIEQGEKAYVGDREGQNLRPLTLTGLSKGIVDTLRPGIAIKVQRVDQQHYYIAATMPWVNELFDYLVDHGAYQPTKLVQTKGTVKLSKLLSDGPTPASAQAMGKVKTGVIMGKIIKVTTGKQVATPHVVSCNLPQTVRRAVNERVEIINPDKLAWLYPQKLLLIGNKKIDPLVTQLRKYVNLTVMDAYEASLDLIFTKIKAADYVFVLLGSVPHALTDYLRTHTEFTEKVQYFYRADANEGVRRLNYLYMNRPQ